MKSYLEDIIHGFRNIKNGFKNLWIWFPIIWKDQNWDFIFIYIIFHKKLLLMEKFIRKYGIHTNNIKDANSIKTCVLLLKRLI